MTAVPPTRIAVLASANWDILRGQLERGLAAAGVEATLVVPPFGQHRLLLEDASSALVATPCDVVLLAERIEDFIDPLEIMDSSHAGAIRARFADYLDTIRLARTKLTGRILVNDFAIVRPQAATIAEQTGAASGIKALLAELNSALADLARTLPDVLIVPVSTVVAEIGRRAADPGKYWLVGRAPFGGAFVEPFAHLVAGILLAMRGRSARAIALDLDNTVWGGIVGDDGMEGLRIGSDFPGNQFVVLQNVVAALKRRGVVLTLLSKNTESVALQAMDGHPAMRLRSRDFVGHRINWQPKSINLAELATELDLSPASFAVIDDNPAERAEISQGLVQAVVIALPLDVSDWPRTILTHPAFTSIDLTVEDQARSRSYEIRREIRSAGAHSGGREAFLRSLNMMLDVSPVNEGTVKRAAQLLAKTNQFNTTGRRYSDGELKALHADGGEVLTVRVTDRFGSDETIGLVVLRYGGGAVDIDAIVMSCRVLGRGVETGILAAVCQRALRRGARSVTADLIETARNGPCLKMYPEHGFVAVGPARWQLDLGLQPVVMPDWFKMP